DENFLYQVKKLPDRTGYRLTPQDTLNRVSSVAADENWIQSAVELRDRTKQPLTAALDRVIRDAHLKRLYENSRTQEMLRTLISKKYIWNAVDTEFIYHL